MRHSDYLANFASRFDVHLKTLQVVDRAMADNGLRRKGTGRAKPDATLRESLLLALAANLLPEYQPLAMVGAVRRWADLPCLEGSPRLLQAMQGKTLIEGLEWLCAAFAEDHELVMSSGLELNKTLEAATIRFGRDFVTFAAKRRPDAPDGQTVRRVSGLFFADVAGD